MGSKCEFIEGCPMFSRFCYMAETLYRMAFCEGDFETCARRKLRLSGETVPENLMPQGGKLWPDGTEPPAELRMPGL